MLFLKTPPEVVAPVAGVVFKKGVFIPATYTVIVRYQGGFTSDLGQLK